jgi:hypothetical protein
LSTESTRYARQSAGLRALADVLTRFPELRTVELASLAGQHPLDELLDALEVPELLAAADEFMAESRLALRTEEADRRAANAGVPSRAARCVCGCSGIQHLDQVLDDGRIPCSTDGCPCADLSFDSAHAEKLRLARGEAEAGGETR